MRFAALSAVGRGHRTGARWPAWSPTSLHAHDWQAGLAPAYLHYRGGAPSAHGDDRAQPGLPGPLLAGLLSALGLPPGAFSIDGVEYYGDIGFLKAGLCFADCITTVSPTYAAEIQTPDGGMGLDGLLRSRAAVLRGILNGIDDKVWDPATDDLIVADSSPPGWTAGQPTRHQCRRGSDWRRTRDALLFGVISRLTWQKGVDLLLASLDELLRLGAQLAMFGAGEPALEAGLPRRCRGASGPNRLRARLR